jgi:hypothetical protein
MLRNVPRTLPLRLLRALVPVPSLAACGDVGDPVGWKRLLQDLLWEIKAENHAKLDAVALRQLVMIWKSFAVDGARCHASVEDTGMVGVPTVVLHEGHNRVRVLGKSTGKASKPKLLAVRLKNHVLPSHGRVCILGTLLADMKQGEFRERLGLIALVTSEVHTSSPLVGQG